MDFSYVHIRYFIGYVYHICLQDTIQPTLSLCLRCQAMLLPMPLRPLLLTTRSGFSIWTHEIVTKVVLELHVHYPIVGPRLVRMAPLDCERMLHVRYIALMAIVSGRDLKK